MAVGFLFEDVMEKEAKINALFWMLTVGAGFVAALILPFVIGTLDKARDKEVAMMLSTIAFAQEAYMMGLVLNL